MLIKYANLCEMAKNCKKASTMYIYPVNRENRNRINVIDTVYHALQIQQKNVFAHLYHHTECVQNSETVSQLLPYCCFENLAHIWIAV